MADDVRFVATIDVDPEIMDPEPEEIQGLLTEMGFTVVSLSGPVPE